MTHIVGNQMYNFRNILKSKFGDEIYQKILSKCKPETKELFEGVIISSEKYELDTFKDMLDATDATLNDKQFVQLAYDVSENQLKGFFGFFIKLINTEKILGKVQVLWDKCYDRGKIEIKEYTDHKLIILISNYDYSLNHVKFSYFYWERWIQLVMKKESTGEFRKIDDLTTEFIFNY